MTSQAAKDLRDKLAASQKSERMAASYRMFWFACLGETPPGTYYDLEDVPKRIDWQERSRKAAVALGLIPIERTKAC